MTDYGKLYGTVQVSFPAPHLSASNAVYTAKIPAVILARGISLVTGYEQPITRYTTKRADAYDYTPARHAGGRIWKRRHVHNAEKEGKEARYLIQKRLHFW